MRDWGFALGLTRKPLDSPLTPYLNLVFTSLLYLGALAQTGQEVRGRGEAGVGAWPPWRP